MQAQTVTITGPQPADLRPVSVLGEPDSRDALREAAALSVLLARAA